MPASVVTAAARSIRPGELVVLTITPGASVQSVDVRVFNRAVPAFRITTTKWQALVGIDLTTAPRTYDVEIVRAPASTSLERPTRSSCEPERSRPVR